MDAEYAIRKLQLLGACEVAPEIFPQVMPRLVTFAKSGAGSVGVARQWGGRLGKADNGQVASYLGYVSATDQSLVDLRLYLPKAWTTDKARLDKAGVPHERRGYRSRHQLALDMLQERGVSLPHGWMAGDDEMGRPYWLRRRLEQRAARYRLAVPGTTLIRDREVDPPASSGRGRRPKRPWQRVVQGSASLSADVWTTIDVRDGAKRGTHLWPAGIAPAHAL